MKMVHLDMHLLTKGTLVEEIAEVLGKDDFDVELYGVGLYDDHLPENYSIEGYRSCETLVICKDGEILSEEEMEKEDNINTLMCNVSYTREKIESVYDTEEFQAALSEYDWDKIFDLLDEKFGK